jgi:hypothetical protein
MGHYFRFVYQTVIAGWFVVAGLAGCQSSASPKEEIPQGPQPDTQDIAKDVVLAPVSLDTALYDKLLIRLAHDTTTSLWPVKTDYPNVGALLPFSRIVAYYGNLYSTRMGILGALPGPEMLDSLQAEVRRWQQADTAVVVRPALHYIAVTAQREPGKNSKYRLRMPEKEILKVIELARQIDALVFLDIQVGHSTLEEEIPLLRSFLAMPNVHLGVDPEYSMKTGAVPGKRVGTMDAADVNYASRYLAELVKELNLPPKILVVHRFKKLMVTNYKEIETRPEVQIVMHMDGFGSRGKKLTTYKYSITAEPVQFTGFKIFYKNDAADPAWKGIMKPEEILKLYPVPSYIQYQ